jgi:hypothetical protein
MPALPATLPDVYILTALNETITVTTTAGAPATITSVTMSPNVAGVNIAIATGTVTITGQYPSGIFPGVSITYITRGSSDKLETPVTVGSFDAIPPGKQVFKYLAPTTNMVQVTFTINYQDMSILKIPTPAVATVTQNAEYNYAAGQQLLKEYA